MKERFGKDPYGIYPQSNLDRALFSSKKQSGGDGVSVHWRFNDPISQVNITHIEKMKPLSRPLLDKPDTAYEVFTTNIDHTFQAQEQALLDLLANDAQSNRFWPDISGIPDIELSNHFESEILFYRKDQILNILTPLYRNPQGNITIHQDPESRLEEVGTIIYIFGSKGVYTSVNHDGRIFHTVEHRAVKVALNRAFFGDRSVSNMFHSNIKEADPTLTFRFNPLTEKTTVAKDIDINMDDNSDIENSALALQELVDFQNNIDAQVDENGNMIIKMDYIQFPLIPINPNFLIKKVRK